MPRILFTDRLKVTEFDPILLIITSLGRAYCALRQRSLKSIYSNEIYCDAHLKRHQIQSLLSTLVVEELKKLEPKILLPKFFFVVPD